MAEYLKIPEVARRLDVSEKTVRRYIKSGALPSTFIGGAYRVTEEDLEGYIRRAEVKPEDASPKAESRSSLEPSFNDVLEEQRRGDEGEVLWILQSPDEITPGLLGEVAYSGAVRRVCFAFRQDGSVEVRGYVE